jgi:hypothetical protein
VRRLNRRLAIAIVAAGLPACKRREPIRLKETEETPASLESTVHVADPKAAIQLVKGFHSVEQNSWRWTMGQFSVTLLSPSGAAQRGANLVVKFTLPDAVISKVKTTTLTATIGGAQVGSATYSTAGQYTFTADVPVSRLGGDAVTVDFALSNFLAAGSADSRELGLVISSIGLEAK